MIYLHLEIRYWTNYNIMYILEVGGTVDVVGVGVGVGGAEINK